MMNRYQNTLLLLARILMSLIFISAGYGKLGAGYAPTQEYMLAMGVPGFMLPLVILLEFGGGLAILFGLLTRFTSLFMVLFLIMSAYLFHGAADEVSVTMFWKNITMAGGFFALAAAGAGKYSLSTLLQCVPALAKFAKF